MFLGTSDSWDYYVTNDVYSLVLSTEGRINAYFIYVIIIKSNYAPDIIMCNTLGFIIVIIFMYLRFCT